MPRKFYSVKAVAFFRRYLAGDVMSYVEPIGKHIGCGGNIERVPIGRKRDALICNRCSFLIEFLRWTRRHDDLIFFLESVEAVREGLIHLAKESGRLNKKMKGGGFERFEKRVSKSFGRPESPSDC